MKADEVLEAIKAAKSRHEKNYHWKHSSPPNSDLPVEVVEAIKAMKYGLCRGRIELQTCPAQVFYCVFWSNDGTPKNEGQVWHEILPLGGR